MNPLSSFPRSFALSLLLAGAIGAAQAQTVSADGAWVRATVHGQRATGGFMTLTSKEALRIVGVSSPVANVAEIHEMKMENDVMRMRALDGLDLPAGTPVVLKPGGHHLMLMELKKPLPKGSLVPVTLTVKDARGVQSQIELQLQAASEAPKQ